MEMTTACPYCNGPNEVQTGLTGSDVPRQGDGSVCWHCGQLSVFIDGPMGLTLRQLTGEEISRLEPDTLPQIKAWIMTLKGEL